MFINVDLPQPEGPTMATVSPSPTSNARPRITGKGPKLFLIDSTTILSLRAVRGASPDTRGTMLMLGLISDNSRCITPPHRLELLQKPHQTVQHESDHSNVDHAGYYEVVTVAGVARIHDQVAKPGA